MSGWSNMNGHGMNGYSNGYYGGQRTANGDEPKVVIEASADDDGKSPAQEQDDEKDVSPEVKRTWWSCEDCTYLNKPNELPPEANKDVCVFCGQGQRPGSQAARTMMLDASSMDTLRSIFETMRRPKKLELVADTWNCSICTFQNQPYEYHCSDCGFPTVPRATALSILGKICMNILQHPDDETFRNLNKEKLVPKLEDGGSVLPILINLGFKENDTHYVFPPTGDTAFLRDAATRILNSLLDAAKTVRQSALEMAIAKGEVIDTAQSLKLSSDSFNALSDEEKSAIKLLSPEDWAAHVMLGGKVAAQAGDFEAAIKEFESCLAVLSKDEHPSYYAALMLNLSQCYKNRTQGDPSENQAKMLYYADMVDSSIVNMSGCGDPNCTNCGGKSAHRAQPQIHDSTPDLT